MPKNNFYNTQIRSEVDMRLEINNLLDGSFPEIAKKQTVVLRRMRRDDDGNTIPCECVDEVTQEPDLDHYCPLCQGEGKYWDEVFLDVYKTIIRSDVGKSHREEQIASTIVNVETVVFYTRSSANIAKEDKIVTLTLDKEGVPVSPYSRSHIYRIGALEELRSDNGRLEYWKISTYEEIRRFLNGPGS